MIKLIYPKFKQFWLKTQNFLDILLLQIDKFHISPKCSANVPGIWLSANGQLITLKLDIGSILGGFPFGWQGRTPKQFFSFKRCRKSKGQPISNPLVVRRWEKAWNTSHELWRWGCPVVTIVHHSMSEFNLGVDPGHDYPGKCFWAGS